MEQVLWFGWFRADIIAEYSVLFWRGLQMTITVTLICIVQGTLLGLAIGMARVAESRHSPAREICKYALRNADQRHHDGHLQAAPEQHAVFRDDVGPEPAEPEDLLHDGEVSAFYCAGNAGASAWNHFL